ncbi:hypothetical protein RIEGSTA812A_PEG_792 [invertebrate metagenome]|uniref:Uncharacterized protein n=1 Tax=invertebrate metagenome TaxID=1711999 RepID=A0A484H5P8_9ZZZZ
MFLQRIRIKESFGPLDRNIEATAAPFKIKLYFCCTSTLTRECLSSFLVELYLMGSDGISAAVREVLTPIGDRCWSLSVTEDGF